MIYSTLHTHTHTQNDSLKNISLLNERESDMYMGTKQEKRENSHSNSVFDQSFFFLFLVMFPISQGLSNEYI